MSEWFATYWPYHLSGLGAAVLAVAAAVHAILYKREVRAAIGWVGLIWLVPFLGALLYGLLGINRIERKALALRGRRGPRQAIVEVAPVSSEEVASRYGSERGELAQLVGRATHRILLPGNHITPLAEGDRAFPAMLEAIGAAQRSITLTAFIFDNDSVGREFAEALAAAAERGVAIRVLIDAAGVRYKRPPIHRLLRRLGLPVALFMPIVFARLLHLNLRNHRKVLVIDGSVAFTGGMNLREGHRLERKPRHPVRDLHFRVEGPVVAQLQGVFAEDWEFSSGEVLAGEPWFPRLAPQGPSLARAISDGPDEDLDRMHWTLLGAIATARRSVRIVTPYFLPEQPLMTALDVAAMRGVEVDIVLPEWGNLRIVRWAMWAHYARVLDYGCRVWLTPPPFDHTKLLVVDDEWSLFGSTNWDPRSLRLNFELNVEAYDRELAKQLGTMIDERIARARRLELAELAQRSLPLRLRDGIARLLSPYL